MKKSAKAAASTSRRPRVKKRIRQPEDVRARILASALRLFSVHGFEGVSVRTIAIDAKVTMPLLIYHFHTKGELWRSAVANLLGRTPYPLLDPSEEAGTGSAREQLRVVIRRLVHVCAETPALRRLILLEGQAVTDRLKWLCEKYLRGQFSRFCALIVAAQAEGSVHRDDPARLRYAVLALTGAPFLVAAEYALLTGRDPQDEVELDAAIAFIERLVFVT